MLSDDDCDLCEGPKAFELGRLKRSSLIESDEEPSVCLHFRDRPAIPVLNSQDPCHGLSKACSQIRSQHFRYRVRVTLQDMSLGSNSRTSLEGVQRAPERPTKPRVSGCLGLEGTSNER